MTTLEPETLVDLLADWLVHGGKAPDAVVVNVPDADSILLLQVGGEHLLVTVNRCEVVPR